MHICDVVAHLHIYILLMSTFDTYVLCHANDMHIMCAS